VQIKKCSRCGAAKPLNEFNKDKRAKDGLQVKCRECSKEIWKLWSSDPQTRLEKRNYDLKRKYGLDLWQWEDLFESQDRCCKICRQKTPGGRGTWHTDHCHVTGVVRGILCNKCNRGLGFLEPFITEAVNYIRASTIDQ